MARPRRSLMACATSLCGHDDDLELGRNHVTIFRHLARQGPCVTVSEGSKAIVDQVAI